MFDRHIIAAGAVGLLALATYSCTQESSLKNEPRQRLSDYISKSFAVRGLEDRKDLSDFLTGDAKIRLSAWSEEQFRQAFMDAKRQFVKLNFQEVKAISANEVNITYELVYLDQSKGKDAKVTNKKFAQLLREREVWYIADVRNIKELVEFKDEMSLP